MSDFGKTLDEMDIEGFFNTREWLERVITDAGATVTDAGIGAGKADLGIILNGAPFAISIYPRPMSAIADEFPNEYYEHRLDEKDAEIGQLRKDANEILKVFCSVYASDQCGEDHNFIAKNILAERGGVLAYIAHMGGQISPKGTGK